MSNYYLYVHILPNNKKYFGITANISNRWRIDGKGYKHQCLFYRAIQKYGWDNIQHIILAENLSKEWACQLEQLYIAQYQTTNPEFGYNVATGGKINCGFRFNHTEEAKLKISKFNKGKKLSDKQRQKISIARKGKFHHTEETKQKLRNIANNMSVEQKNKISVSVKNRWKEGVYLEQAERKKDTEPWNKGLTKEDERVARYVRKKGEFHHTEETKQRLSISHKGKPASNRKKVQCLETGVIYDSALQASIETGCNNISKCARDQKYSTKGLHWRYVNE